MAATTALAAAAGGMDIMGALFGMSAADAEARMLRGRASLLETEAEADIARYRSESESFKAEQSVRFLKSGVTLEGSPLEILDETTRVSMENISAMRSRAKAEAQGLRYKAAATKAVSRNALLSAVGRTALTTARTGSKLGWWDKETELPDTRTTSTSSKLNL